MPALKGRRVLVLVQGELAQSPRMLNHTRELLAGGAEVQLVGFAGVALPSDLATHPGLSVHAIARLGSARLRHLPRALFIPAAALRTAWLAIRTAWLLLCALPRPHTILVQNPPALPTAVIAVLAARFRGAALIVDWHNLSAAMLALRIGGEHPLIGAMAKVERWLAGKARANLCVSESLRAQVQPSARGACVVLHDRPRRQPRPIAESERDAILNRVSDALGMPLGVDDPPGPIVLASSTSWSEDEDMMMLLEGLSALPRSEASRRPGMRPLVLIATGLGPGRPAFDARAREIERADLRIATGWLTEDLYRDLLRAAHLGISTHRSASGLDLPMKIVDMIEAGLPILAFDYGPCLAELLPHDKAAGLFRTSTELANRLQSLLCDDPALGRLESLRAGVATLAEPTWSEEWRRVALPILAEGSSW